MICNKHPLLSKMGDCGCGEPTPEEEEELSQHEFEDEVRVMNAELTRRSLKEFVTHFWSEIEPSGRPYVDNMATDAVLQHLQAVGDGQITLLGIAAAPGSGKSACCSVAYPAWMWARDPSWRVICASYAMKLSRDIADRFYRVVTSDKYIDTFPHVSIDSDAIEKLSTTSSGRRYAVGLDGAITGIRGNCGIVDDSLNAKDMDRNKVRDANAWFNNSFNTRFDNTPKHKSSIIVVQQRFTQHDLIDYVKELGGEILELPARYEIGRRCVTSLWQDPRTVDGELLAPEIHSEKYLEQQLRALGPMSFASQYQQRPAPREGTLFKIAHWEWCNIDGDTNPRPRPEGARSSHSFTIRRKKDGTLDLDWFCVSMDPTGGAQHENASAVGLSIIGGKDLRRFVLEDIDVGPRGPSDQIEDLKRAVVRAGAIAGKQRAFRILIEKKALGVGVFEHMEKAVKQGELRYPDGTPIIAEMMYYEPSGKGDKKARADHLEPDLLAGLIYLLDGASFVPAYVEEFGLFPSGSARDDRVDVLAQCLDVYRPANTDNQWMTAAKKFGLIR